MTVAFMWAVATTTPLEGAGPVAGISKVDRKQVPFPRRAVLLAPVAAAVGFVSRVTAADDVTVVPATDQEWRQKLSPLAYKVMREGGTERQFTCRDFLQETRPGTFVCAGCNSPLFDIESKFDSGTGWPSFADRAGGEKGFVSLKVTPWDAINSRAECKCRKCDSHLGHRFPDGPSPTGMRYCINGVSLAFVPM